MVYSCLIAISGNFQTLVGPSVGPILLIGLPEVDQAGMGSVAGFLFLCLLVV